MTVFENVQGILISIKHGIKNRCRIIDVTFVLDV